MAVHVSSSAEVVPAVSKGDFYSAMLPGDLVFCSGRSIIDGVIEKETNSPWSHVFMCWIGVHGGPWSTLEATFTKGVHVGLVEDYVDRYDGQIVLARRPELKFAETDAEVAKGLTLVDDSYDFAQEVSIAARKLVKELPLLQPKHELYCSGLQYVMSLATPFPLRKPDANMPTPEDIWLDASVKPICRLI